MAATEAHDITGGTGELKEVPAHGPASTADRLEALGTAILRYGLVFVLLGIGSTKFFGFEAKAIQPLVAHSPLVGWLYPVLGLQGVSNLFGVSEITTGILIALRPISPKLSAIGSLAGVLTFLTTLSFLFTTPGALAPDSAANGFLVKDIVLLGASVYTAGEALVASVGRAAR